MPRWSLSRSLFCTSSAKPFSNRLIAGYVLSTGTRSEVRFAEEPARFGDCGAFRLRAAKKLRLFSPLEAGHWSYGAVVENGIYYLPVTARPAFAFDVTRRATRILARENRPVKEAPGLAVSPDKGAILYTLSDSLRRDIMLVENFRLG